MVTKVYIPRDSSALAVGAEKVAAAVAAEAKARGLEIEIVRNGSRGLYWLETMVEVATQQGRVAYGPVKAKDVASHRELFHAWQAARSESGADRRAGLAQEAAASDFCAGWHHRPGFPGRLYCA